MTFAKRFRQKNLAGFGDQVIHAIRMFFFIVFPLFIFAAFIEKVLIISMGGYCPDPLKSVQEVLMLFRPI